jgi:hypothetical protein
MKTGLYGQQLTLVEELKWTQYQQRMNALDLSAGDRERVVQAAGGLFVQLETVFQALYPFRPESKTFLVTSINPEAGRHPIPADAREVQASLRAADRCWHRFPYLAQRYGERGWRFARSAAAWQATLYPYDSALIGQQVRWLGRVLAARGMPTVLLQAQLEILVEDLTSAIPEKQAEYAKLLRATAELHDARSRHLTDEQFEEIAGQFDRAAGPEWSTRLPHTGALLVCAVVDELDGYDGAVDSLRPWLTDAVRFPAEWVAAVEATLDEARRHTRRPDEAAARIP